MVPKNKRSNEYKSQSILKRNSCNVSFLMSGFELTDSNCLTSVLIKKKIRETVVSFLGLFCYQRNADFNIMNLTNINI